MKIKYKIKLMNLPDDFVVCQICGNYYKLINQNHLDKHNITRKEYKKHFPNSPLICADSLYKYSKASKKVKKKHPEIYNEFYKYGFKKNELRLPKIRKNANSQHLKIIEYVKQDKEYQKSKKNVHKIIAERRKKRKEYIIEMKKMLDEDYSVKNIADKLGVHQGTVYEWIKFDRNPVVR